ncbi:fatty acid desaturase-domain-containing protein [Dichotomocladium elegans]|nr:fatty acid desaturase-domain-containing protein [Dichotomocladium elegans]
MPPNTELCSTLDRCVFTLQDVEQRVKQGEAVFIFENKVYRVDRFLSKHPGGELAIRHVLGKDVTDEIRSMHPPRVYESMIRHYEIGDYWPMPVPSAAGDRVAAAPADPEGRASRDVRLKAKWQGGMSIEAYDGAIEDLYNKHNLNQAEDRRDQGTLDMQQIRAAYRRLEREIRDRGYFECNRWRYGKECCRYVLFLYLSLWFTLRGSETWQYLVGAFFLGCFWHQLVFTAHDAGHNGITGRVKVDHTIGVLIADFIGGLSIGWWKHSHNVHHIVTNHPEHDPDIQHLPFFAITTRFFNNIYSTYYKRILPFDAPSRFFVRYQHYLYYIILSLARFNLHRLSFQYLLFHKNVRNRKFELAGIGFFFCWFGALLSTLPSWPVVFGYLMISYIVTSPLHVQITLSHFGMSTDDLGPSEPFPAKQLRTTMDVDCPEWFDWFHGGLQYQAVHHLFPRLPRHYLRHCVPLVRAFCKETGLQYYMYDFTTGNGVILGALKSVADQVHLMNDVAKYNSNVWAGDIQHKNKMAH